MTATARHLAGCRFSRGPLRIRLHGGPPRLGAGASRRRGPRRSIPEYIAAIDELGPTGPLIIGGKSMGGRVASMVADELYAADRIAGLLCLGYPFHPPGKPDQLRTAHLADLKTPALIVPGNARRVRHARGGIDLRALQQHRDPLAGGWRPRPEAAQEHLGLFGGRSSRDCRSGRRCLGHEKSRRRLDRRRIGLARIAGSRAGTSCTRLHASHANLR